MSRGLGKVERTILEIYDENFDRRGNPYRQSFEIRLLSHLYRCHEFDKLGLLDTYLSEYEDYKIGKVSGSTEIRIKCNALYVTFSRALNSLQRKGLLVCDGGLWVKKEE